MEKLPVEMHTEIFSYLDNASLNTSATVCKDWRATIRSSTNLMKNTKLRVHDFGLQRNFIRDAGKRFKNVSIKNKRNGQNTCTRNQLLTILKDVANVKNLEMSGDFLGFSERSVSDLQLKNLEELTLNDSANSSRISKILKHVKVLKLSLDIRDSWAKLDKHFLSWFMQQNQMQQLHIREKAIKTFFYEFPASKLKIQLKELTIAMDVTNIIPDVYHLNLKNNILVFLQSQIGLQSVTLPCIPVPMMSDIYAHLLKSKTLKTLKVCVNGLPSIFLRNRTLECFTVKKGDGHHGDAVMRDSWISLKKLETLRYLEIQFILCEVHYPDSNVQNIVENCVGLNELQILKLESFNVFQRDGNAFQNINLPNLKEIDLTNIYLTNLDWTIITTKCPLIGKITLNRFVMEAGSAKLICESFKNLKEIALGYGLYLEEIFPVVLNTLSLKDLKINEKMMLQLEGHLNQDAVPFKISVETKVLDDEEKRSLRQFMNANIDLANPNLYLDNVPDLP